MRLDGKVAIVTGAGGGIGRATAVRMAEEGARLVCADLATDDNEATAALVREAGSEALTVRADVSIAEECAAMVESAESAFGRLDVLFNNAGISHADDDDAVTTTEDVWDLTMAVNVKGVWLGCKYGIPAMQRAGGGSIINTASFVALMGAATPQLAYTASKGAVLSMSRELAVIHAREGIRVNALCPGMIATTFHDRFTKDEVRANVAAATPLRRQGDAREVAETVAYLASDESSFLTGVNLDINGGMFFS